MYLWIATRVTGLALTFLVVGHFALTHFTTDVADTGSSFVTARWASGLWIAWDTLLLTAALIHAYAGLAIVIADHVSFPNRRYAQYALTAVMVAAWVIGASTIVSAGIL